MLMVIDIGNSNITYAVFDGEEVKAKYRLGTKSNKTSDEYAHVMLDLLQYNHVKKEDITGVAIASVVPNVMHTMKNSIYKYLGFEPLILTNASNHGIELKTDNPMEVGVDRIADVIAAHHYYGGPCLVVDFGTATTYDVVSEKGEFLVGITAPGIKISAKALWTETAKLPDVQIISPGSILAKNTVTSMQAGLIYGKVGELEYIVNRVQKEMGMKMKVIVTGGLARIIEDETDIIDVNDQNLTLNGIRLFYERNKDKVQQHCQKQL